MLHQMRYLGIDYGTKRIGIAISDEEGRIAFPLTTITADREALSAVDALIKKHAVQKIVLGESRNFKQEQNPLMEDVEQFKKDLAELSGLPVVYEPEFLTSAMALRQAQGKRGETIEETKSIDASAAALILQSFLDKMKGNA